MQHQRPSAFVLLLLLAGSWPLTGCCVLQMCRPKPEEKVVEVKPSKYEQLAAKAEGGSTEAARELAKWCYLHDADNERAKHWLEVAARNGDKNSARIAEHVQEWQ